MTTYGLVLFPDVEELDFVGPWEVFATSSMVKSLGGGEPDTVVGISQFSGPVRCAKGMRVVPDHTLSDHPDLDVVLVPGGQGARREKDNRELMGWLANVSSGCRWVASVCTGALLLHEAGPGKGRRLTTHWAFEEGLAARGNVEVVSGARWVQDGNVVSSQGVSAGIDMALWLVGQLESPGHARTVQRYMQYDPDPPYQE